MRTCWFEFLSAIALTAVSSFSQTITTVAGNGSPAIAAALLGPLDIVVDASGDILVDYFCQRLWRIFLFRFRLLAPAQRRQSGRSRRSTRPGSIGYVNICMKAHGWDAFCGL